MHLPRRSCIPLGVAAFTLVSLPKPKYGGSVGVGGVIVPPVKEKPVEAEDEGCDEEADA